MKSRQEHSVHDQVDITAVNSGMQCIIMARKSGNIVAQVFQTICAGKKE